MNTAIVIGIMGAVIAGLASVCVALIAARTNKSVNAVAWSAQLVERLERVEGQVEDLTRQLTTSQRALTAAIRFIDRLVSWGRGGGKEAMPNPPASLHEYLDADLWGVERPSVTDLEPTGGPL